MKIVFVGHLPGFGGAEKSMIMTANALAQKGHKVSLISVASNNPVYPIDQKIEYIYLQDKFSKKFMNIIGRFCSMRKTLSELKPDIVICFWLQVAIIATLLSKFYGFKVIYSERGDPGNIEYNGLLGLVRKLIFPLIDGFVFQSDGARNYFPIIIQKKSTVIPNPVYISYDDYPLPVQRDKVIANVGRLHPQKNQKLLINAFSKIYADFPDYQLHIYGDGELRNELQQQINDFGLNGCVILKGTTKQILDTIVKSALFVLTSDYEGMPNALMEAMALGIPCISTDCPPGGPDAIIIHGKNGLLFPVGDELQLEINMRSVLTDTDLAEIIALNAKNICLTHSPEVIFCNWDKFILKIYEGNA